MRKFLTTILFLVSSLAFSNQAFSDRIIGYVVTCERPDNHGGVTYVPSIASSSQQAQYGCQQWSDMTGLPPGRAVGYTLPIITNGFTK